MSDSSDPMDCNLPGFSIHGIFQAKVLEWGAIAFSELIYFTLNNLTDNFLILSIKILTKLFLC